MKTLFVSVVCLCVGMLFSAALTMADRSRLGSNVEALTQQLAAKDADYQSAVNAHKSQLADRERQASELRQQLADVTEKLGRAEKILADLQAARKREQSRQTASRPTLTTQPEHDDRPPFVIGKRPEKKGESEMVSVGWEDCNEAKPLVEAIGRAYALDHNAGYAVFGSSVWNLGPQIPKFKDDLRSVPLGTEWTATVTVRLRSAKDEKAVCYDLTIVEVGQTSTVFKISERD